MIEVDYSGIKIKSNKKLRLERPAFVIDKPPIQLMKKIAKKYSKYKNIVVIGNGGSITSSFAFYTALGSKKKLYVVSTMEPDFLLKIKNECKKTDTLVIPISKSGNTVGVIEAIMAFIDYKMLIVTSPGKGAIYQIAQKLKIETIDHPEVGGRFSGRTTCGLLPGAILGLDINEINKGAISMYNKCQKGSDALKISNILFELDKKGYNEVFMPIYSTKLEGFSTLIVQLIHESSGKKGKGQTFLGALAPESQHHTNQRFFGGKKNMVGMFIRVKKQNDSKSKTKIPKTLLDIKLRDGKLKHLNNIPLEKSLEFEFLGTKKDADKNKIPNIVLTLDKITPKSIGEFLGLWQYIAVYSSALRRVNPFDQPQVENSKAISFELRKKWTK